MLLVNNFEVELCRCIHLNALAVIRSDYNTSKSFVNQIGICFSVKCANVIIKIYTELIRLSIKHRTLVMRTLRIKC